MERKKGRRNSNNSHLVNVPLVEFNYVPCVYSLASKVIYDMGDDMCSSDIYRL